MTIKNILTIDVEDWFMDLKISTWNIYESRVVENTKKILKILENADTKATFFVLGYVGEQFPELIKDIHERGHEIATHGYGHIPITNQKPQQFEEDLLKAIKILENTTKTKIVGYRACQFTISKETAWAIDIMKKNGLKYDSSVFPVKTHLYGVPDAPTIPYRISSSDIIKDFSDETFLEFPLSTYRLPLSHKNIPIAGGFYLRLFPYWFIKHSIKKINKMEHPAICYLHPWEIDPNHPRLKDLNWYHYFRLNTTEKKFIKLVNDFEFISIQEWIQNI